MIAVDSSALMAIALQEADAVRCETVLETASSLIMSAVTYAEVLIVAQGRGLGAAMKALIEGLGIEIIPVDDMAAEQAAYAYRIWGKGQHRAALNFGDCFAYVVAKTYNCPLLYIGNDFSQTDLLSAL